MNLQAAIPEQICPRAEIAVFLEGELAPQAELVLEKHLSACKKCLDELNSQKQLLRVLDSVFEERAEIELPKNFTKVIVARAESNVSGLRRPEERFRAVFLCVLLFLIVLIGLSAETRSVFSSLGIILEQTIAVAGFVAHLFYDFAVGTVIILRSLSEQFVFGSNISLITVVCFFALSAFVISRLVFRLNRS